MFNRNEFKNYLGNNRNEFCGGIRCVNLNDRFNDVEGKNPNDKNFYDNYIGEINRKDSEFSNNFYNKIEGFDAISKKGKKIMDKNNQKTKKILFGNDSPSFNDNKVENIIEEKNNMNMEDKVATFIVEESILNDIKNVFGNNLTKKEYIFNSLNSSIISNFNFSPNESSSHPQSLSNQNSGPVSQPPAFSPINISQKKDLKNLEAAPLYIVHSTNNSSIPNKCTCKNSNCFKLYCECFSNGRYCDNCSCINCKNTVENKELRNQKYEEIISRNPKALQKINSTKRSWNCKCKHSNCLKKYCDCLQNGRSCTSKCKCINCYNKNNTYNRNHGNDKKNKIKKIKSAKKNDIINEQNNENEINEELKEEKVNDEEKKKIINLSTPKKNKNYLDNKEIYIYYDKNETSTAAMTGKKIKRKIMDTRSEKKNKNIYTKLQMDNDNI